MLSMQKNVKESETWQFARACTWIRMRVLYGLTCATSGRKRRNEPIYGVDRVISGGYVSCGANLGAIRRACVCVVVGARTRIYTRTYVPIQVYEQARITYR